MGVLQPWLTLDLMRTPVEEVEEHTRIHTLLQRMCGRSRDASAAVRCTARLLGSPHTLQLILRFPIVRWHYTYTQHNISGVLSHLGDIVQACVPASVERTLTFREVARIASNITAHPAVALRQPRRAAAAAALTVITTHCMVDSILDCEPRATPVIDMTGPEDALPVITELLLGVGESAASLTPPHVIKAKVGNCYKLYLVTSPRVGYSWQLLPTSVTPGLS